MPVSLSFENERVLFMYVGMKKVLFLLLSFVGILDVYAQKTFPLSVADNKIICTESESYGNKDDRALFVNALLWAIDRGPKLKEDISQCGMSKLKFTTKINLVSAENAKQGYECFLSIQVASQQLVFLVHDISCITTGILGNAIPFEKLVPEKKEKHKAYMEEFVKLNTAMLNELIQFVGTNTAPAMEHWDKVCNGNLESGMNETECKLIMGKPVNIQDNGKRVQWMYDTFTYLIFEDGVLKTILR